MMEGWKDFILLENPKYFDFGNGLWKGKKPPLIPVAVIRNTNFTDSGEIDYSNVAILAVETKQFQKRQLVEGDIIIERSGGGPKQPVGRVVYFSKSEGDFSFSNFTSRIRVVDNKFDSKYIFYHLMYFYSAGKTISLQAQTTGIRNLDFNKYKKTIRIPDIPLPEQRKIANVLSTVQKAIEQQDKLIKTTTELKKALMQKLFTEGCPNYDLNDSMNTLIKKDKENHSQSINQKNHSARRLKETEIGLVPESWDVVEMQRIVDFKTGKLNSNAANNNGAYPFFTCSQETFRINTYAFNQEAILLSGNNARAIYSVKHYKGKFNAYQRTYVITILDENEYSYLFLKEALSRQLEYLRTISIGSQTRYLTLGMLTTLQLPKPNLETQIFIGKAAKQFDRKIEYHQSKKQSFTDLFKTLLHELMTGQRRVNEIDFGKMSEL